MANKEVLDFVSRHVAPFRVTKGKGFRLKDFDPGDTLGLKMDKGEAADLLQRGSEWLAMEQDILYAQDSWSVLLVFQAMDAAGKDGTIKHVMSRRQSAGLRGPLLQAAVRRGALARLPLALRDAAFPSVAGSASSTGPTTRKCSSCACTRSCSRRRRCRRSSSAKASGTSGSPTSRASRIISRGRAS